MVEEFLMASNFTPEEQSLLNELLDADADPTGINMFDLMTESLKQSLAHARGEIKLPSNIYECTFPDCPTCGSMKDGDCEFKNACFVALSDDDECRVGCPSRWIPTGG